MKIRLVGLFIIYLLIACFVGSTPHVTWLDTFLFPAFMLGGIGVLICAAMMLVTGRIKFWEEL